MALITLGANSGKGKVLQVSDMVIITSEQTLSTDTYTDLTSATLSITPSSSSNKILLIANINARYQDTTAGYGIKFFRDSTNIFTTLHDYASLSQASSQRLMQHWNYIDTPSSTSAITYKIQAASHSSNIVKFQNSAQSTFYAMEIEG
jgi:hypothetical protein